MSDGRAQFQYSYQISPIILIKGIAADLPGGLMPIVSLLQGKDFATGVTDGTPPLDYDSFFAQFMPMVGANLIANEFGRYPFANQTVAANAVITQPLRVSLVMSIPPRGIGAMQQRSSIMSALQKSLALHTNLGGTYNVATPTYLYTDCLLLGLRDIGGDSKNAQTTWQWDFEQPLLTLEAAREAQNSLMAKISLGTEVKGDPPSYSGLLNSVGEAASGVGSSAIPAAQNTVGASAAGRNRQ